MLGAMLHHGLAFYWLMGFTVFCILCLVRVFQIPQDRRGPAGALVLLFSCFGAYPGLVALLCAAKLLP